MNNNKSIKFWIKTAIAILLSVLLLINVLTIVFSRLGLRQALKWFPGAFITVDSGSMEPAMSIGDLAFIWRTPYEKLEMGDIVTICSGDELLTHEIIGMTNETVVTKGLQNAKNDLPSNEEAYCAKVMLNIRGGAAFWKVFTSTWMTVLLIVLIAILFYAFPIYKFISERVKGSRARLKVGPVRVLLSFLLVSVLFTTPFLTSGKYREDINDFTIAQASEICFASNYLSKEGSNYYIKGWLGLAYEIQLKIRNYDNNLLFNEEGIDVPYTLRIVKDDPDDQTKSLYKFTVVQTNGTERLLDEYGTSGSYTYKPGAEELVLEGSNDNFQSDDFRITVESAIKEGSTPVQLPQGTKIQFSVYAETAESVSFYSKLVGKFTLEVADAQSFIGENTLNQGKGNSLVTYTLKTNLIAGSAYRDVVVQWDPDQMYLDVNDKDAADLIELDKDCHDKDNGTLRLTLKARSTIKLQFYKRSSQLNTQLLNTIITEDDGSDQKDFIYILGPIAESSLPPTTTTSPIVKTDWNGLSDYIIPFTVKNWKNLETGVYNHVGNDFTYTFTVERLAGEEYQSTNDYSLMVGKYNPALNTFENFTNMGTTSSQTTTYTRDDTGDPFKMVGHDDSESAITRNFAVKLQPNTAEAFTQPARFRVTFTANFFENDPAKSYSKTVTTYYEIVPPLATTSPSPTE